MAVDSSSAGGGFQVQHDILTTAATTQVPNQVKALGATLEELLSRKVDPAAFGEVDSSADAGQRHLGNIQDGADHLTKSQRNLTGIGQNINNTTQRNRAMDDGQASRQQEQNAQLAQAAEKQVGQRDKALDVLNRISKEHPESVATVAKRPLEWFTSRTQWSDTVRNAEAGEIGDHYEKDVADVLALPPTDRNLRALAEIETEFWKSDRGSTLGGLMSADWRYDQLWQARHEWLGGMSLEDEARIRARIGVPSD